MFCQTKTEYKRKTKIYFKQKEKQYWKLFYLLKKGIKENNKNLNKQEFRLKRQNVANKGSLVIKYEDLSLPLD